VEMNTKLGSYHHLVPIGALAIELFYLPCLFENPAQQSVVELMQACSAVVSSIDPSKESYTSRA
jgi:hypothetical protein